MEFNIDLYDPVSHYEEKENKEISLKKLRTVLKDRFDQSSALDGLKAQLRKQLLTKLMEANGGAPRGDGEKNDLKSTIAMSCIFSYLKLHGLHSTLSVFTAESGMESERSLISEMDICRMMKFNELSCTYKTLNNIVSGLNEANDGKPLPAILSQLVSEDRTTLLDVILEYCLSLRAETTREISIQAGPSVFTARELLDHELFHVEREYTEVQQRNISSESSSIEERMIAYQKEIEIRKNREVELQVKYFKEHEATKIRTEEASKARAANEALRQELEFDYSRRLKVHTDREADLVVRSKEAERRHAQALHESRQQMERELDEIRSRENLMQRKVELESQGLRLLEVRLKEAQLSIESRERELRKSAEDVHNQMQHARDLALKEANTRLQREFDELNSLRLEVSLEKRRLDEDRVAVQVEKEALRTLRDEVLTLRERVVARDQEILQLRRQLANQAPSLPPQAVTQPTGLSAAEKNQIANVDRLIAENYALRQEIDRLRQEDEDEIGKLRVTTNQLRTDLDIAKRELSQEKARAMAREHKIEELRQLIREKTSMIDSLTRQIESQNRREQHVQQNQSDLLSRSKISALEGRYHMSDEMYERIFLTAPYNSNNIPQHMPSVSHLPPFPSYSTMYSHHAATLPSQHPAPLPQQYQHQQPPFPQTAALPSQFHYLTPVTSSFAASVSAPQYSASAQQPLASVPAAAPSVTQKQYSSSSALQNMPTTDHAIPSSVSPSKRQHQQQQMSPSAKHDEGQSSSSHRSPTHSLNNSLNRSTMTLTQQQEDRLQQRRLEQERRHRLEAEAALGQQFPRTSPQHRNQQQRLSSEKADAMDEAEADLRAKEKEDEIARQRLRQSREDAERAIQERTQREEDARREIERELKRKQQQEQQKAQEEAEDRMQAEKLKQLKAQQEQQRREEDDAEAEAERRRQEHQARLLRRRQQELEEEEAREREEEEARRQKERQRLLERQRKLDEEAEEEERREREEAAERARRAAKRREEEEQQRRAAEEEEDRLRREQQRKQQEKQRLLEQEEWEREREEEERAQAVAKQKEKEKAEEAERLKREEQSRQQQQEDDEAAAIAEARARVLARRKQKANFGSSYDMAAEPAVLSKVPDAERGDDDANHDNDYGYNNSRTAATAAVPKKSTAPSSSRPSYDLFLESDSSTDQPVEVAEAHGEDDSGDRSW